MSSKVTMSSFGSGYTVFVMYDLWVRSLNLRIGTGERESGSIGQSAVQND